MAEHQFFKHEPGMGSEAGEHGPQKRQKNIEHNGPTLAYDNEKNQHLRRIFWSFHYPQWSALINQ